MPRPRLRAKFRDLPINTKFLLCLTTIIMLPLLMSFLLVHNNYEKEAWQKYDEQRYLTLMEKNNNLGYLLGELSDNYVKTLYQADFRALERNYWLGNELSYERMRYEFTALLMRNYGSLPFELSVCLSHDGRIIYQYNRDSLRYESLDDADAAEGGTRFELTRFTRDQLYKSGDSLPQISIVGKATSTVGVGQPMTLRLSAPESYVFGLIDDKVYDGTRCFLVDDRGRIVSAGDKSLLNQPFADCVQMAGALPGGGFHSRVSASLGGVQGKYLMLSYPVRRAGWTLVYFIPASGLDPQTGATSTLTILAMLACVLFGALFYMVLSKTIIRPINGLKNEMLLVGGGEREAAPQRGDEVRLLREGFEDMLVRLDELIEKVYKAQLREKDAQYQALVSQINPHFLYNTLDSIRFSALLNKDAQVAEQIETLSGIFRHVLSFEGETPTIAAELNHLKNYVAIQRLRFDDRIQYEISCPDELLGCESLKLLLQPLCENAILHGHESSMEPGHIAVRIFEAPQGVLVLQVEDDGLGADAEAVNRELAENATPGSMIALKGIAERIRIKYGPEYGLRFESELGKGTLVTVRMPKIDATGMGGGAPWK